MVLRIYNTLTKRKEKFVPLKQRYVKIFVCGPTVYDFIHLGHARTYIMYDIIAKYLETLGYDVFLLVNITDIEDKIFERAEEERLHFKDLTEKYTQAFYEDLKSLKITSIDRFAKASDYLDRAYEQINTLLQKNFAYRVDGDIYFDTSRFPDYGRLSHQTPIELKLRRLDPDSRKKNQTDFLLWKSWSGEGPSWKSPFGRGRPGWHIEDTAITITIFGPQYDIHGGAADLVYPHHEAEIAQAEAFTEVKPFVRYWVHTGILNIDGSKMSKSLGNFITVRQILQKFCAESLRLFFSLHHYRDDVDFQESRLKEAEAELKGLWSLLNSIEMRLRKRIRIRDSTRNSFVEMVRFYERRFQSAMNDDFNTPRAVSSLFVLAEEVRDYLKSRMSIDELKLCHKTLRRLMDMLGLLRD